MKNEKQVKKHKNTDKGRVFVKVTAAILAVLMVGGTAISLIYALIAR
ncbi:MAG: hypothetical protein IKF97_07150 [Clostridia bacterium]|nr:hypothetical protein [Clostridia bacterium]